MYVFSGINMKPKGEGRVKQYIKLELKITRAQTHIQTHMSIWRICASGKINVYAYLSINICVCANYAKTLQIMSAAVFGDHMHSAKVTMTNNGRAKMAPATAMTAAAAVAVATTMRLAISGRLKCNQIRLICENH